MIYDHSVELGAIGSLASPVMISSGTFGVAKPYMELLRGQPVGAVVTKTITLNPKAGNPQPRIYEGPCYLINSIGLENQGVDRFVDFYNDEYGEIGFPVIVSISGNSVDEFVTIARKLNSIDGLLGLELNLSCPNVDGEGLAFGSVPERIGEVVKACGSCSRFPLIAKLSPFQGHRRLLRARGRPGRCGCHLSHQHRSRDGAGYTQIQASHRRAVGRHVGTGRKTDRAEDDLRDFQERRYTCDRNGWHRFRRGCHRVPDGRGEGYLDRNDEHGGSLSSRADNGENRRFYGTPRHRKSLGNKQTIPFVITAHKGRSRPASVYNLSI